jgi:sugar lactone lactonase YvrE
MTIGGWLVALLAVNNSALFAAQVQDPKFILAWGQKGEKEGEFHSPIQVVIDKHDQVFVTDLNNSRLQKFTTDGKYLGGFALPLDTPPRKSCIVGGMAVDDAGLIYLSFMIQNKLRVYNDSGELVREWGQLGPGDGEFHQPGGIVLHADGTLFVTDQCNHRIQHFTLEGKYLGQWGEHGTQPGQFGGTLPAGSRFGGPHFLAVDSQGRLYTTEGSLGRVQQFSPEGAPLLAWGNKGDQPGGFGALQMPGLQDTVGPIGVFVDRQDRACVSSLNDRVQMFTTDGKFLVEVGSGGKGPGQFARPHGMAMDSKGYFYVADSGNQRIQKFEILGH